MGILSERPSMRALWSERDKVALMTCLKELNVSRAFLNAANQNSPDRGHSRMTRFAKFSWLRTEDNLVNCVLIFVFSPGK